MTNNQVIPVGKNTALKINELHKQIDTDLHAVKDKIIDLGKLLTEQKAALKRGQFGAWIQGNLIFSERTARNYMKYYRDNYLLKTANVADYKAARKVILSKPKKQVSNELYNATPAEIKKWLEDKEQSILAKKALIKTYEQIKKANTVKIKGYEAENPILLSLWHIKEISRQIDSQSKIDNQDFIDEWSVLCQQIENKKRKGD